MTKLKEHIRTCVSCRNKLEQNELIRLQCINSRLITFTKTGRSFYLCIDCSEDKKKCNKALRRQCRNKDDYFEQLKEIV